MDYIPWQQFYQERKDKQTINEMVAEYNKWLFGYESFQVMISTKNIEDEEEQN